MRPSEVDAISSSESDLPPKKVTLASSHQDATNEKPRGPKRNDSVYSSSGRRVSEWEALQIVAAGDLETIDREVDEIEASLQQMNIQSTVSNSVGFFPPRSDIFGFLPNISGVVAQLSLTLNYLLIEQC